MSARILVIEDKAANLDLMTYLLRAFGHTPVTAQDGEEGLQAASREALDLILCDVQLPKMDGYEVAQRLKSDPRLQTIPLVAVTALAMVGDRDKMLAAGFDGYIAKPIAPETFVRDIEVFLPRAQHATPLPTSSVPVPSAPRPTTLATRATLLVLDNQSVNRTLAQSLFEPFGYVVLTARNIDEGLTLARQTMPDLIISDVHLEEELGYAFLTAVKADPHLRAIPFVFLTSTATSPHERARGLGLGAARFLLRPLEPHILLAEIEACLREATAGEP